MGIDIVSTGRTVAEETAEASLLHGMSSSVSHMGRLFTTQRRLLFTSFDRKGYTFAGLERCLIYRGVFEDTKAVFRI
jgi:hypothetical protein